MRKLSLAIALALFVCMLGGTTLAETNYGESPLLAKRVEAGELPPVTERLPEEPKLWQDILVKDLDPAIGNYGGTLESSTESANWDAYVFVGTNEALLSMTSENTDEILGNILKSYEVNDDFTEFTFHMRPGLRWSDGEPVTMEDFLFTYNDFIMNPVLTPAIAANHRAGGQASGTPMTFEALDDWTFKITFDSPYGGFLVYMSIKGWCGYTDMLKPSHYLKQFHIDYAEECHGSLEEYYAFIAPFAEVMGYDDPKAESVWMYVFNQIDMTNWELTDPAAALTSVTFEGLTDENFPVLYAWMMEDKYDNITTWVRNPYYFKVDAAGNQLPYIDRIQSKAVENTQLVLMEVMTGHVDGIQLSVEHFSLLKENEEGGGYTVHIGTNQMVTPTIQINATYGLNTDGTVKDDDASKAWREVIEDARFREALKLAISSDELIETQYYNFAVPNERYECVGDTDRANALLDEMGMLDIDGDGFRETPSGLKLQWQIWCNFEWSDYVGASELYTTMWGDIGLNVDVYTCDQSLQSTAKATNEVPMLCLLMHQEQLWHFLDWGFGNWDPLWDNWVKAGGLSGEIPEDATATYLTPPDWYIELRTLVYNLMTATPDKAVNEVLPSVADAVAATGYVIIPMKNVSQLYISDADMRNIPTAGLSHSFNSSWEIMYFESFTYDD